jgi:transcriptional regulator with XRE-family HTH domain
MNDRVKDTNDLFGEDGKVPARGQEGPLVGGAETVEMNEIIQEKREERGLSQAALGKLAGVEARQIRRYEAGESHPTLPVAVKIAKALGISVDELAGLATHRVDLAGSWWTSWQTSKDFEEVITAQEVEIRQQGEQLRIETTTRGIAVEDGGYHWKGELRLWDNEVLIGWYAAEDGAVRSKGTFYFTVHPHGVHMKGRWVGMSYDGSIRTGWGAIARSEAEARALIADLKQEES